MKIWFDISNAPHINLFKDLIKDLEAEGHEIIVTCRPLSNTISLLELHQIPFTVVGIHYGKNFYKKLMGFPIRVRQLYKFLKPLKIDVAISQSSFHSPITSKLLGKPAIYMNDNEHAMGNIPSFIFAERIMIPEFLDVKKVQKQWASKRKIVQYPGVKEGIYLWQKYLDAGAVDKNDSKPKVYIRPEPRTAQYYKGGTNFLDSVILGIKDRVETIILTRDGEQFKHYRSAEFAGVTVPEKAISFDEIAKLCHLFIGAGGTMTREMAVIGIPTISVYQDELLDVDQYLLQLGLMQHRPELKAEDVLEYLKQNESKAPNKELLQKGQQAYHLIKQQLKEIYKK
jgi:hypothetical protein